jgi:hypothetical protein
MNLPKLPTALILAGAVAGLVSVSPALSFKGPVPAVEPPTAGIANGNLRRSSKPVARATRVALSADPGVCTTARRSLWVEGEGWIVRRVSVCR